MTEILTESFCERCGTRYTFESVAPRQRRLGRLRVVGRGLKNFVLSDDSSLDEAMAAARSDAEREATAQQLDAFHGTFNFCMSCRQYTCSNCWNVADARCLSCSPLAAASAGALTALDGHDHAFHLPAPTPAPSAAADEAWPAAALEAERAELVVEDAGEAAVEALPGMEAGESLDDAIAAYEATQAEVAAAGGPGVDIVEQPAWPATLPESPPAELEPEPGTDAEIERVPEPIAAAEAPVEIEPPTDHEAEPEPEPVAAAEPPSMPAAPVSAPPAPAALPPAAMPPAALPPAAAAPPDGAPQWPTGPRWPTAIPARQSPSAPAQPPPMPGAAAVDPLIALMARHATDAMWAASSRDLVQAPAAPQAQPAGVQPCVSCGISLSANARFCRRCGTAQGG